MMNTKANRHNNGTRLSFPRTSLESVTNMFQDNRVPIKIERTSESKQVSTWNSTRTADNHRKSIINLKNDINIGKPVNVENYHNYIYINLYIMCNRYRTSSNNSIRPNIYQRDPN